MTIPVDKRPICGHPNLGGPCEACRCTNVAREDRSAARTLQRLIDKCTKDDAKDDELQTIREALVHGKRALRNNAKVWDDIAREIITKYEVQ